MADEEALRATGEDPSRVDQGAGGLDAIREAIAERDASAARFIDLMQLRASHAWKDAHPDFIDESNATHQVKYLHSVIRMLVDDARLLAGILIGKSVDANDSRSEDHHPPGAGAGQP